MSFQARLVVLLALSVLVGGILFVYGNVDLFITSWFFDGHDFDWRESALANFLHNIVHPVAIASAVVLGAVLAYTLWRKKSPRPVVFLLLTLIIGPGIITNSILKDHWDRARPLQVLEFGGDRLFTPPLIMSNQCSRNCSFVAGDPAMGFWFHSFGYLPVSVRRRRQLFAGGIALGLGYGVLRIGMGAHFLSDVFFAGVVVLGSSAVLCRLVIGRGWVGQCWRVFLGGDGAAAFARPAMRPEPATSRPA